MNVFTQFRINSPQVAVQHRPQQGQSDRHLAQRYLHDDGGRPRLALRQQLHVPQPVVAGRRAGRRAVPQQRRIAAATSTCSSGSAATQHPDRNESVRDAAARCGDDAAPHATGAVMTPLSALDADVSRCWAAPIITHYNLYRNIELNGSNAPGTRARAKRSPRWKQIAQKVMPKGVQLRVDRACSSTRSRPDR